MTKIQNALQFDENTDFFSNVKTSGRFFQTFVPFWENRNFMYQINLEKE